MTGSHIRWPSPVTINKPERPNGLLGGNNVCGLRIYHGQSSQPTGWDPLNYLMTDNRKDTLGEFQRVCFSGSKITEITMERHRQPKLGSCVTNREGLDLSEKVVDQSKI